MSLTNFKVIVVGGGPVGLTCAHALSLAGIDFVVLERRSSLVIDAGSNLVLTPMSMRALGQLGLLDNLNNVSSPLKRINRMDHSGQHLSDMQWFCYDKENFGAYPRVISRHDLTKVLYESLSTDIKSKLLPNKKLSNISATAKGVIVNCGDGTSYEGSVVIGADGAHSSVRDCMRQLAVQNSSPYINEENPFLTAYRCFWVRFPTPDNLPPGTTCETHGYTAATQLFAGVDTVVTCVYERLAEPTRDRSRHTEADQADLVERWGHLPLIQGEKLTLRDAYESRLQSGLVSLEEGVVNHWSWDGRVALVGDAAHKFTPSTGAGFNNGVIDIVALVNALRREVQKAPMTSGDLNAGLEKKRVVAAFRAYQASRKDAVLEGCSAAGNATAIATWQNRISRFIGQYIFSIQMIQKVLSSQQARRVAQTPVFDFIDGEERLVGKVPWSIPLKMKPIANHCFDCNI